MYKWNDCVIPKVFKELHKSNRPRAGWQNALYQISVTCAHLMCTSNWNVNEMFDLEPPMATKDANVVNCNVRSARIRNSWPCCNCTLWAHLHAHATRHLQRNYVLSRQPGIHGNIQLPDTEKQFSSKWYHADTEWTQLFDIYVITRQLYVALL